MTQRLLLTAHRWAIELEQSDKVVRAALENFPADGKRGEKQPRYYLATVFQALGAVASDLDLNAERARLARSQTEKIDMENDLRRGALIDAAEAQRVWADHISAARSRLLALESQIASELPRDVAPQAAKIVRRRVHEALDELASLEVPEPGSEPTDTENGEPN